MEQGPDSEHEQGHERRQTDRLIARLRCEAAVRDAQLGPSGAGWADAERELDDLRAIRDALTPSVLPERPGMRLAAEFVPAADRVSGDFYQAMREPRPYRPARSADDAAAELRAEVQAGRLDADAVEAVLGAAGHNATRRREGPAGLTPREVEILGLLARGLSNKEIAARLVVSPKTVGKHVERIYTKIDTSSRAAAGRFASQHGLLADEEPAATATA